MNSDSSQNAPDPGAAGKMIAPPEPPPGSPSDSVAASSSAPVDSAPDAVPASSHPARDNTAQLPADTKANDAEVEAAMHRVSRRSFLWAGVTLASTYGGWRWLNSRRQDDGIIWPFRRALQFNEDVARDYFKTTRLAPTFAPSKVLRPARTNGDIGLGEDFDPATWKLHVEGLADRDDKTIGLAQIKALPRVDFITELKCIEGWSMVVHWTGARLSDFIAKYPPATISGEAADLKRHPDNLPAYVGMETPDGSYYVGIEREAALHPQTLLCYEMNGVPLTAEHGAPLRLAIPVKYGIKNIKRIGKIRFTNERPLDYWAEQGYDYYAGH